MNRRRAGNRWFPYLCIITAGLNAAYTGGRLLISYRIVEIGGSSAIGLVAALYSPLPLMAAIPVGRAADGRYSALMLRGGAGTSAAALTLIAFSPDVALISAGAVLLGFGNLLTAVSGQGYIPALSRPEEYDKAFSGLSLAMSVGQTAVLPLAGGVAASGAFLGSSTTVPLLIMAGLAAVATLFSLSCHLGSRDNVRSRATTEPLGVAAMLTRRGMLSCSLQQPYRAGFR